jgi:signal transduction histidine kinase
LVKEGVKRQAKTFINKRIKIDIGEGNLSVLTDRKWLMFIIDQILSNSLKYTGEGGKISIVYEEDVKEKRLVIEDNGIGIPPEDLDRVFEKGFTGNTGRQHYKSTGMGLYLAKKLCRKLGHDISIESEYGRYTRVVLHFPKHNNYLNVTKM